jgi:hypothetical protein
MSRRPDDPFDPGADDAFDRESERALGEALRAAWAPGEIDRGLNQRLIDAALADPLAPPSEEELVESERLRRALEGHGEHPSADLARALAAAARPRALGSSVAETLAGKALGKRHKSNVIFVSFGAAAAFAAAAAVALLVAFPASRHEALHAQTERLFLSRSTAPLFDHKFETAGTTARIDRIASARERDLRANLYAQWGVR